MEYHFYLQLRPSSANRHLPVEVNCEISEVIDKAEMRRSTREFLFNLKPFHNGQRDVMGPVFE